MRRRLTHPEILLQNYGIVEPSEIDLETLAWLCGAKVREEKLDGCEAKIFGRKDKAIIIVNSKSSEQRKRFSIGHELGHWYYDKGRALTCHANDESVGCNHSLYSATHPERVADDFASNLLMPNYMFQPLVRQYERSCFRAIEQLKDCFNTSFTATALRFIDISPEPAMLVCYDSNGKMAWFKRCPDLPDKLFPKRYLDTDTLAYEVFSGKSNRGYVGRIPADAWFDDDSLSRFCIYEETIRIYGGQILTLLTWRNEKMLERYY